ncbi:MULTISPECIES: DUF1772 domain-containing protein [Subtercola]|uniref:DUF1772 domain-containing protein n=1 Tax=Subtercola vilae TaxID=2056433 RepID=A0A4T2C6S4_9MICO|nr:MULTISPECIES: DUF1772 domain-containing protein [Subtercola]MEA9984307.1 DUF1772 domain-containing protein [Subtercola sp. RTI3]TIH40123.1 DUF1772 domain-containing protein [Subtercola vilae]
MNALVNSALIVALLGTALVFGTDAFSALVLQPALKRVDDPTLTSTMGNVHRYGDKRMPVPGVIGLIASAAAAVLLLLSGTLGGAIAAGLATLIWVTWLVLYVRISAPINRVLTAAADSHETPANARALQRDWDKIIWLRAALLGLAVLALALALIV